MLIKRPIVTSAKRTNCAPQARFVRFLVANHFQNLVTDIVEMVIRNNSMT